MTVAAVPKIKRAADLVSAGRDARKQEIRLIQARLFSTPGRLRLSAVMMWILTILMIVAVSATVELHRHEMQTIGKDAAPSIIAADRIKTDMADLHGDLLRQFLGTPAQSGAAAAEFQGKRREVTDGILVAAQNITYGDEEKTPIRRMMNGLSEYDDAVGRALALHGQNDPHAVDRVRDADTIMHDKLFDAADALDRTNQRELDKGYNQEQITSGVSLALADVVTFVLIAYVIGLLMYLRRKTRRHLNPAVAAAGLISIGWMVYVASLSSGESHELKIAKQDAFDSISVLSRARADSADGQDRLYLALLDPASARAAEIAFDRDSNNLANFSNGLTFNAVEFAADNNQVMPENFKGYIASELRNLTFDGEPTAAHEMLHDYAKYDSVVTKVRQAEHQGDHAAAVMMCLGDSPEQAVGVLKNFDSALGKTMEINQAEFDKAVVRGFDDMRGLELWTAIVLLAAAAVAQVGISRRLNEYRP